MLKNNVIQRFFSIFFCFFVLNTEVSTSNKKSPRLMKNFKRLFILVSLVMLVSEILF